MKTRTRPPYPCGMLAVLIAAAATGLPSSGHASSWRPSSALVDEVCEVAAGDDAIEARLRCVRLRFLHVLGSFQPPASEVVATPGPALLFPGVAGGPAPPMPARFAAGAALTSLLVALIVCWRRSRALQAIER